MLRSFLVTLWIGGSLSHVAAAVIELRPVADTTLHQIAPSQNMGGHPHVAIGSTAKNTAARGLFRFDLSEVPTGAVVTAVSLRLNLPQLSRPDLAGSAYAVHRMLKSWGEGSKTGNLGAAAGAGEATWLHREFPTTWESPGGGAGTDFVSTASAVQVLGPAPGVYTFDSTEGLVADVQAWIGNGQENFGWMLKAEDESVTQTARQFSSREAGNAALLRAEYTLGAAELRITSIERVNTNVVIRWTGGQGSVVVERGREMAGSWETVGTSASGVFTNSVTREREFMRLKAE